MKLVRWLALVLSLLAVPALAQDEAKPDYYGVWKGTIGTYPVVACVSQDGGGTPRGGYYYLSSLVPIGLQGDDSGGWWNERDNYEENGASWRSVSVSGDRLSGSWKKGKKSLPIALARQQWQAGDLEDEPCMSDAFLAPRAGGGSIKSSDAAFDGQAYRTLEYVAPKQFDSDSLSIQTFALPPAQSGDDKINAELAKVLPDGTWRAEFLQCFGQVIGWSGTDGDYWASTEPTMIAPRWLNVIDHYDESCGGAHPETWYSHRLFDRDSGKEIDLFRWLNGTAVEHVAGDQPEYDYDKLLAPIRDVILAREPFDDQVVPEDEAEPYEQECRDFASTQEFWTLGVSRKGMLFVPSVPRVILPCLTTFTVPWAEMQRFLSKEGVDGLRALRED